ncbi:MAG: imidazole glycerol phosphate synthase subunit HisH [Verrucomicrobiales bacterium]|nr:imidazole glycerol phosphate synthase subunit HisH [Verrucomicrobiales bacterium]
MADRVGVIDYGGGNLQNVLNVLKFLGHEGSLVSQEGDLDSVDRLLFPGVGSFGDCVEDLDRKQLRAPLEQWLKEDRPYFGICLGYQVLFEKSAESPGAKGLGFLDGEVVRFDDSHSLKIPHMGWNEVNPVDPEYYIWKEAPSPLHLYFVHSFYPQPSDPALISSTAEYGNSFASSIAQGNIFAGQFHPERSQDAGLKLISNFLNA